MFSVPDQILDQKKADSENESIVAKLKERISALEETYKELKFEISTKEEENRKMNERLQGEEWARQQVEGRCHPALLNLVSIASNTDTSQSLSLS